jgi:hypothetical protein
MIYHAYLANLWSGELPPDRQVSRAARDAGRPIEDQTKKTGINGSNKSFGGNKKYESSKGLGTSSSGSKGGGSGGFGISGESRPLPAYQQCGGIGGTCTSAGNKCKDAPFPNSKCEQGYTCKRGDEYFWQVRLGLAPPITLGLELGQPGRRAECGAAQCVSRNSAATAHSVRLNA